MRFSKIDGFQSVEDGIKESFKVGQLESSALFIVDMNNGFAIEGALSSPRVKDIIPAVRDIASIFIEKSMEVVAFTDCHDEDAVEFKEYPVHCLKGTRESELVDEIKAFGNKIKTIGKNSTNALLEKETLDVIDDMLERGIKNFIVTGCCTDICVSNFSMTLKCYLNKSNKGGRVIVPLNGIETFDAPYHPGDFMNMVALKMMMQNGVEVVKTIEK